jgi:uncharacterized protein (TIGR01777 family)
MKNYKKIVLAGGSGQIGTALCKFYADRAEKIIVLSRGLEKQEGNIAYVKWDAKTQGSWTKELEGTDILINLTGKNVNCRYTKKNMQEIFDSRTSSTRALATAIKSCKTQPRLWVQSASATIYRHAEDRPMTEKDGKIGSGFSVEVCKKWESVFWEETLDFTNMRKVILRTSLVLGKKEGVFPRLRNLTRAGLGGKQGNGEQWVSWIHEADVVNMIEWIATHADVEGIINCTAPVPLKNKELMQIIRKGLHMPIGLPSPAWLLELGAIVIRTETELILKSRWVLPRKIVKTGFQFQYPEASAAINDLIHS